MARENFTLRYKTADGSFGDLHPRTNVQQVEGASYPTGTHGTYTRGVHFDGGGLPTLQAFLDANINGRAFFGSVTIDNGNVARTTSVTIRNVLMQGQTLNLNSAAQFAGTLTVTGVIGAVTFNGDWGAANFATALSIMSVVGSVTLNGDNASVNFNNASFFNCQDVRITTSEDAQTRINGTLLLSQSTCILNGRSTSQLRFNQTHIRLGSRLEIAAVLGPAAVTLDTGATPGDKHGFVLDNRVPARSLETFIRGPLPSLGRNTFIETTEPSTAVEGDFWLALA